MENLLDKFSSTNKKKGNNDKVDMELYEYDEERGKNIKKNKNKNTNNKKRMKFSKK